MSKPELSDVLVALWVCFGGFLDFVALITTIGVRCYFTHDP